MIGKTLWSAIALLIAGSAASATDIRRVVTGLDANIAGYAVDSGCSIIITVNKWDAIEEKGTNTAIEFERELRRQMKFLDWAPVVTISALTGQRVTKILPIVSKAFEARNRRIPTAQLNRFFEASISQPKGGSAPATTRGGMSRLKVQFIAQAGIRPPLFILFTSGGRAGLHFSYLRYIENRLREEFEFFATPIRLVERHKLKKKGRQ